MTFNGRFWVTAEAQIEDDHYVKHVTNLFGITQSKKLHGHEVKLILYRTVDEFIESYIGAKKRKVIHHGH